MIAVIILNYNTSEDCRTCISYVKNQIDVEVEIIVVDNCSMKEEVERLSAYCRSTGVTLLQSDENRGYSAGNNVGLRYAAQKGYAYALIINPDVEIPQQDSLQRMVTCLESDPTIAMLGTDIVHVDGRHQNPLRDIHYFEELFWPYEIVRNLFKREIIYTGDHTHSDYCSKLHGCCFMVRLSFIEQVGFLDEHTFLYCEEGILAKQVESQGLRLYYMADRQVFHNHIATAKGDPVKQMEIFVASRCYFLKRYSGYSVLAAHLLCLSRRLQYALYTWRRSK